jgi:hypothetical protein
MSIGCCLLSVAIEKYHPQEKLSYLRDAGFVDSVLVSTILIASRTPRIFDGRWRCTSGCVSRKRHALID